MTQIDIAEANYRLIELIKIAVEVEEVIITENQQPLVKITPINKREKSHAVKAGSAKGKVWMSDDFDAPLEDFKDYM